MAGPDTAVVFLAHQFSLAQGRRFERLWRETAGQADSHVLLHDDGGPVRAAWQAFLRGMGAIDTLHLFRPEALAAELGYPMFGGKGLLGNVHFPLLRLARTLPHRRFWQIESDVEYRGSWRDFLRAFGASQVPLLVSHLQSHAEQPDWFWWVSAIAPSHLRVPQAAWRKAFFPVSRFDRVALEALEAAHRAGWHAHFEALVPTALSVAGVEVRDLRDCLPCYEAGPQDPDEQTQSTIRWRPEITREEFTRRGTGPLLFHPVKQDWWFDGAAVVSA